MLKHEISKLNDERSVWQRRYISRRTEQKEPVSRKRWSKLSKAQKEVPKHIRPTLEGSQNPILLLFVSLLLSVRVKIAFTFDKRCRCPCRCAIHWPCVSESFFILVDEAFGTIEILLNVSFCQLNMRR